MSGPASPARVSPVPVAPTPVSMAAIPAALFAAFITASVAATPASTPDSTPASTPAAGAPAGSEPAGPPSPEPASPPSPEPAPPAVLRLTLAGTVERALGASPQVARLRALERAAEAGARGAASQGRPLVGLSAGYTRFSNVPDFAVPQPDGSLNVIFPNIPDEYRARLGVTVPLYTGGRVSSSSQAAEHDRTAAARDVEGGSSDTTLEARAAYWDLVAAREEERVLREAIAAYDAHLAEVRDREQVGMAARNDVLTVQVDRDRAELARMRAGGAAEVANANLCRILGIADATRVEPADVLNRPEAPAEAPETMVTRALDARPERAALRERIAAAEARIAVQRAGARPQASLQAGYDYANPNRRYVPPEATWQDTWDIGVGFSFTLLDAGRTASAVDQAASQAEAARRQLEDFDRRLRLEVVARSIDLRTAIAAVDVAERNVDAATENVRVAHDRFGEGLVASADLLDAETALLHAGLDRIRSLAQAQLALASLERAVGR